MPSGRPQGRNDPSLISSLETAVRRVHRPGPVALAWNWRFELAILAAVTGLSIAITGSVGLIGLAAVSGAGLAVGTALLCWPPARKRIIARAWCVITPHRVRAGCVNAWVQTRSGRLPIIWSTTPTDYGERLRLWCPAGITAADLIGASEVLAAACGRNVESGQNRRARPTGSLATGVRSQLSISSDHFIAFLSVLTTLSPEMSEFYGQK